MFILTKLKKRVTISSELYLKEGVNKKLPKITLKANESLERALRRFKRKMEREGILKQLKARKHYEKPSERKRRKARNAKSRKRRI